MEKKFHKAKKNDKVIFEWKEAARRVDNVLFMISFSIIIFAPTYLFGKYFIYDTPIKSDPNNCGCIYS